jgi:hypothetical protein
VQAALQERDRELTDTKRLLAELKDYAEQLQNRVVELIAGAEPMAKALPTGRASKRICCNVSTRTNTPIPSTGNASCSPKPSKPSQRPMWSPVRYSLNLPSDRRRGHHRYARGPRVQARTDSRRIWRSGWKKLDGARRSGI